MYKEVVALFKTIQEEIFIFIFILLKKSLRMKKNLENVGINFILLRIIGGW